jgi:hypothetical protein
MLNLEKVKCVAFGKIGTAITFSRKNQKNPLSAIYEVTNVIEEYAKKYPEILFYIISRSDIARLKEDEYKKIFPNNNVKYLLCKDFNYNFEYLKDFKILPQVAIIYAGPSSKINRNDYYVNLKVPGEFLKTTCMFYNYAGPAYWFINELKILWIYLGLDPRYIKSNIKECSDMHTFPEVIGNLYGKDEVLEIDHRSLNKDGTERLEKASIPNKPCYQYGYNIPLEEFEKKLDCGIKSKLISLQNQNVSSKDENTTNRWKMTNKYILDNPYWTKDNCEIIGDWSNFEKQIEASPKKDLFVGTIPPNELYVSLAKYKYAILFSMCKGMSSGKFYEMIAAGIIPFVAEDYDESCVFVSKDSFLRVKTPEQLVQKVKLLEENSEKYIYLISELRSRTKNKVIQCREKFDNFIEEAIHNVIEKGNK